MNFMSAIIKFWLWLLRFFSNVSNEYDIGTNGTISGEFSINSNNIVHEADIDICVTQGCVFAANDLLNAMNTAANPCEDFYEYACGQWIQDHTMLQRKTNDLATFQAIDAKTERHLKVLLGSNGTMNTKPFRMARILYHRCANSKQIDMIELVEAFRKIAGWPFLEANWNESAFSITEILASLSGLGSSALFNINISVDEDETTNLYIKQEALSLFAQERYFNGTERSEHVDDDDEAQLSFTKRVFDLANVTYNETQLRADVGNIIVFESEIAKKNTSEAEQNMSEDDTYTIRQLYTLLPQMDWLQFFLLVTPESVHDIIDNNTNVTVSEPEFLRNLAELMNITSRRTLANYIFWRAVEKWITELVLPIRWSGNQLLWQNCIQYTATLFPKVVDALLIRNHFDAESRKEGFDMMRNIHEAFRDIVDESDWLDERAKKFVLKKAEAMTFIIRNEHTALNDTALEEYYETLNITHEDTYFEILRNLVSWQKRRNFLYLKKPFDPTEMLDESSFSSSPFYLFPYNFVGYEYDERGRRDDWWSNDSYGIFNNKTACFIEQYGNYEVPNTGLKINGTFTLEENIADNGGIKQSFRAYKKYIERLGYEEPRLPGMQNYTNEQLFFLSYARMWCAHRTVASQKKQIHIDTHSPEKFRVNAVLANFPEFSKVFNCPRGYSLNPLKRCSVW